VKQEEYQGELLDIVEMKANIFLVAMPLPRLAKEIVDDVEQLLEQSLEYARFYEPESYQNTLVTLTLVRALRRM
jgi:hypothetical protein